MSTGRSNVDLGFAEECDAYLLRNVYFPSKIGGKPAWLDLDAIPSTEELVCKKCGAPQTFLCQVYAPLEDKPECFHRTIFLFICRETDCFVKNSSENVSVFRCQLPRQNKFYSAVAPEDDDELAAKEPSCKTCSVCGCRGSLMCSRCKNINYCSAKHQRAHWSQHKTTCSTGKSIPNEEVVVPVITFEEFEIAIEEEKLEDSELLDDETSEKNRLAEFQKLVEQGRVGTLSDIPESELNKYTTDDAEIADICFQKFKERIAPNPTQVLRYQLGGQPLWIADVHKTLASVEVPSCESCNGERQFEFQIMPQMVNYLKDDNIDWGVLAVYTCKSSCGGSSAYAKEFVLKQDIVSDDDK